MKHLLCVLALSLGSPAVAQDVAIAKVGDSFGFDDVTYLGESPSFVGYTFGTTACNVGDQELIWIDDTDEHPIIALNMFRIDEGRIEQLGYSRVAQGVGEQEEQSSSLSAQKACLTQE